MKTNSEIFSMAFAALKGKWLQAVMIVFIYMILSGLINAFIGAPFGTDPIPSSIASIVGIVLTLPLAYGAAITFLSIVRDEEVEFGTFFSGYKQGRVWSTVLLKGLYIFLWCLLLLVPGIIKSYSYAFTEFIIKDNPEMKNNAAIEKSMEMMMGKKLNLFLFDLCFGLIYIAIILLIAFAMYAGYSLLMIICIATIFVTIFIGTSLLYTIRAIFYEEALKQESVEVVDAENETV